MRRDSIVGFGAVLGLALLVGHGVASAQAQNAPQQPPDAGAGLSRQVNLSPAEQLAQADGSLSRMEGSRSTVRRQLESARAQRDVVKTLCLNDKLSQIDTASRTAADRTAALRSSVNRNDAEAANHEYSVLAVLAQRSEQLGSEASQCVGEESAFVGDTAVKTTIDPTVAPDDATYPGFPVSPTPMPPPCLSCQR